jgi:uncharacterized membrane protein YagU involved in acid resistance
MHLILSPIMYSISQITAIWILQRKSSTEGNPNFGGTQFLPSIELVFCGFLGVVYYAVIPKNTNKNYLIKGWLYGVSIWLFLCTMGMVYKIPYFTKTPWQTTNSDFITSSIYGIVLASSLRFLDKKYEKEGSAENEG